MNSPVPDTELESLREATKRFCLAKEGNEAIVEKESGLAHATVSMFRNNRRAGLSLQSFRKLRDAAERLGIWPPANHVRKQEPQRLLMDSPPTRFPLRGYVCAGEGTQISETIFTNRYERHAPAFDRTYFANGSGGGASRLFFATVRGDSMEPYYLDGDGLVVEYVTEREALRHRDVVVVDSPTDGRLLRFWSETSKTLEPMNRKYDGMTWPPHARLRGIVRGVVRKIR